MCALNISKALLSVLIFANMLRSNALSPYNKRTLRDSEFDPEKPEYHGNCQSIIKSNLATKSCVKLIWLIYLIVGYMI